MRRKLRSKHREEIVSVERVVVCRWQDVDFVVVLSVGEDHSGVESTETYNPQGGGSGTEQVGWLGITIGKQWKHQGCCLWEGGVSHITGCQARFPKALVLKLSQSHSAWLEKAGAALTVCRVR